MNETIVAEIEECSRLSQAGQISFGEVVQRLIKAGVERYHADYSRAETTYYLPNEETLVIPLKVAQPALGETFSAEEVQASVRGAQRGEVLYPEFVRRTKLAGCVGYFVLLTGKCVQYLGRRGEIHTEWFPGAPVAPAGQ
ncbi:MAG TPA: DUF1398 domain-containing protein [Verrucomicrobiae bacterium]